jgi:FAD/FMN-containing dehydrogenase
MGASQSVVAKLIKTALGRDGSLYAFPGNPFFQIEDVKPYNLAISIQPAAVTYPKTAAQVAAIIKCAVQANLKVQARSGGHSYANYCNSSYSYEL